MQLYDPGSKHTLSPVSAVNEDACCVKCMESAKCYGAELYGESCYLKTVSYHTMRVELISHFKPCMTDIYLHFDARMADYIHMHP
eukprot:COSAG05_NODE_3356_length_2127_cov_1.993261_3_plen_85_part_00